jgi:hypothetical protein
MFSLTEEIAMNEAHTAHLEILAGRDRLVASGYTLEMLRMDVANRMAMCMTGWAAPEMTSTAMEEAAFAQMMTEAEYMHYDRIGRKGTMNRRGRMNVWAWANGKF